MSTLIRRLFQNNEEFIPITAAEAVAVDTSTLPGFTDGQITTLEKVLKAIIGLVGSTSGDLTELLNQINAKQDKLTAGTGIEIDDDGTISVVYTQTIFEVVAALPTASKDVTNKIYVVPQSDGSGNNYCDEYVCVASTSGAYIWELIGKVNADIDLSSYAKLTDIITAVDTKVSITYDLSGLWT